MISEGTAPCQRSSGAKRSRHALNFGPSGITTRCRGERRSRLPERDAAQGFEISIRGRNMNRSRLVVVPGLACAAAVLLSGCPGDGNTNIPQNLRPAFLGTVTTTSYDGVNDDLLTAGLGASGLGAAAAPAPASPTAPTAAELRRLAIFNNYRAILDISPKGGYGVLYGPNID